MIYHISLLLFKKWLFTRAFLSQSNDITNDNDNNIIRSDAFIIEFLKKKYGDDIDAKIIMKKKLTVFDVDKQWRLAISGKDVVSFPTETEESKLTQTNKINVKCFMGSNKNDLKPMGLH